MKQSIKPDWQPDKCAVVHDIGHNPSVRGSHKGGLINPIDRMTLNLHKAQQQLFVLLIESNNSKSDHLPDDKRVASRSIAARPAELTICEPARRSVGHPDNGPSGTDPNDGSLHDGPHRTLSLDDRPVSAVLLRLPKTQQEAPVLMRIADDLHLHLLSNHQ